MDQDDDQVIFEIEKALDDDLREAENAGNQEEDLISETVMRGKDWNAYDFTSFLDTVQALEVDAVFMKIAKKVLSNPKYGSDAAAKIFWATLRGYLINEEYKRRRRDRAKDPVKKTESLLKKIQAKQEKLKIDQEEAERRIHELKGSKKRRLSESD